MYLTRVVRIAGCI